jgi:opacity protein-like surface antigen
MIPVRFILALLVLAFSTAGNAADPDSDQWQFTVTPYLWVATISGTTGSTSDPAASTTSYNFLSLDNLDSAFFIAASASRGRWTIQTDMVFLNFSDDFVLGPITAEIDLKGDVFELTGAYLPRAFEHTEILFGVRRVSLELGIALTPGPQESSKQIWLDPLIGLRHIRPLGERWQAVFRADIGGFGVSSDFTFNGLAGASFNMTKHSSLFLGYRYLTLEFGDDDILEDLTAKGLALGVEFSF